MLDAEKCWVREIEEAHTWFFEQLKGHGADRQGNQWKPDLHKWRSEAGCSFSKWVRKAGEHAILQNVKQVEWNEWHFQMIHDFIEDGLEMDMP